MQFEYDAKKSEQNLDKHGIDFETAQQLWDGAVIDFEAKPVYGEQRTKTLGRIRGEYWAAISTDRNGAVRIISVRLMTAGERSMYDRYINEY